MQNEPDLQANWPELRARAADALRPNLAARVQARLAQSEKAPPPSRAIALSLGTAAACCLLTFCLMSWKTQSANSSAVEQWVAFNADEDNAYTELTP